MAHVSEREHHYHIINSKNAKFIGLDLEIPLVRDPAAQSLPGRGRCRAECCGTLLGEVYTGHP